jgi:hypothetical protein
MEDLGITREVATRFLVEDDLQVQAATAATDATATAATDATAIAAATAEMMAKEAKEDEVNK